MLNNFLLVDAEHLFRDLNRKSKSTDNRKIGITKINQKCIDKTPDNLIKQENLNLYGLTC